MFQKYSVKLKRLLCHCHKGKIRLIWLSIVITNQTTVQHYFYWKLQNKWNGLYFPISIIWIRLFSHGESSRLVSALNCACFVKVISVGMWERASLPLDVFGYSYILTSYNVRWSNKYCYDQTVQGYLLPGVSIKNGESYPIIGLSCDWPV